MNHDLSGKTIAMLATDGVEQQELEEPREALQKAGATVHVVSVHGGSIRAWNHRDWGDEIAVDRTLDEVSAEDYDGLVVRSEERRVGQERMLGGLRDQTGRTTRSRKL